jgi:hypothetical protein
LFSLLVFSVLAVKICKNKVVLGLVVVVRNVGSMSWFGNVPKPVSSTVFSELIDSKKKKKMLRSYKRLPMIERYNLTLPKKCSFNMIVQGDSIWFKFLVFHCPTILQFVKFCLIHVRS